MKNLLAVIFSLFIGYSFASHIAGGEITYECLGGNQYRVKYVFFRDCSGTSLPNSINLDIFDASQNLVQSPSLSLVDTTELIGSSPNPCTIVPNVCLIIGEYEAIITLPPLAGGYQLATENCCRNGGIVNGPAGNAAYTTYVPDPGLATCNNSAVFNGWPPVFVCHGTQFDFDHSATDADGDSLVYSLCTPYESVVPSVPYPFSGAYNAANPIGNGNLTIDPVTGLLSGTPNTLGRFVVGVCVSEYRNGVLINTSTRDFQINVVMCQDLTVASAINALTNCNTKEVTFFNNSTGAGSYFWDFGDGTTSTDANPIHNYPNYQSYNVTLIAYNATNPICNDTVTTMIALVDTCSPCGMHVEVNTVDGVCDPINGCAQVTWTHPCSSTQTISYGGVTIGGSCGGGSSISTGSAPLYSAINATVDGVALPQAGVTTETVTVLGPASPCSGFVSTSSSGGNITYTFNAVYTQPQTGAANVVITGGTPPYDVQWVTTPTQTGTSATNIDPGTYNVVVTDANGCVEVVTFVVAGQSSMNVTASGTDITTCGANDGTLSVNVTGATGTPTYLWTPGGYTTANVNNVPPGFYTIQVTDDSCSTTDTITIHDVATIEVDISTSDITCPTDVNGSATVTGTTGGTAPYTYTWSSSPVQTGTSATGLGFGFYTVTATDQNGCTGDTSFAITGPVAMSTSMSATSASCANTTDGSASVVVSNGTPGYNYSWNTTPIQTGTSISNVAGGTEYTVTITDANGCVTTDSIYVDSPPPLNIDLFDLSTIDCAGNFDGSIYAEITGGQPDLVNSTIIYDEQFNTNDLEIDCGSWHTDVSGGGPTTIMDAADFFRVINNQFQGQDLDGEGVWFSAIVDISGQTNVTLDGDFFECGNMEATDYVRAYYKIDGGPEILWFDLTNDGGVDCNLTPGNVTGLNGNTVQIVVRMLNNSNENHRFDNIVITGDVSGVLYNETFDTNDLWNDPECDWWRDVSAVTTTDISGAGTADHVETRNGAMEFWDVDGEIIWYSAVVDISSCAGVSISADFGYGGNMDATEYIRAYYSIDGGPEILWADHTDDTPANWPGGNPSSDQLGGLTGGTIQIIVRVNNTGSADYHTLDNVQILCESPNPVPYDFTWSCSGSTNDTISGLAPGTCTITVTDSAGCVETNSIDLISPGVLTATADASAGLCGPNNGTATAFGDGGNLPYSYSWDCSGLTTQLVDALTEGTTCQVTITDADGCTATASVTVPSDTVITADTTFDVCSGGNYTYADGTTSTNITVNESHVSNLLTVDGCDSLLTENLNVVPSLDSTVNVDVCYNSTYTYADGTVSTNIIANESHVTNMVTAGGCDSIITENLTVLPEITSTLNVDVCSGGSYTYADGSTSTNITVNESQTSVLVAANGCDSTLTENVNVLPASTNTVSQDVCEGDTYTFADGSTQTISTNTSLTTTLTSINGCDSVVTEDITMLPIHNISENVTACENSTYTYPDGSSATITATTSYVSNLTTATGCDSIITTNVTMLPTSTGSASYTVCEGGNFTYVDGTTSSNITANESHVSTLVSANGCDSVVTEDVTVIPPVINSVTIDICSGTNFTYADGTVSNNVTVNENHTSTLVAGSGCDSLLTENLNIVPSINNTINVDVCFDASYTYGDGTVANNIQSNESHVSNFVTASGCDSIVTENLTVIPQITNTVNIDICSGSDFTYLDGTTSTNITTNENHVSTLTASNGCDSLVTEDLTVLPTFANTVNVDICDGDTYTFADGSSQTITGNTSLISTLVASNGCDSVVTENITMLPTFANTVSVDVCDGDSYTFADGSSQTIVSNTSLTTTLTASNGCDSIVTEDITVLPIQASTNNYDVCEGGSFTYADGTVSNNITANENHISTLVSVNGCDSLVTENVNVINTITNTVNVDVCEGQNYTYADGTTSTNILVNESHVSLLVSAAGCDSVLTENINVILPITNTVNADICFDDSYTYADGTISNNIQANESHTSTLVAASGCDSIVIENLTSLSPITHTENHSVCEGQSFTYADGTVSTNIIANESHVSVLVSSGGCDSTLTENLNVNPVYALTENVTVCENDSYTYPDGSSATITSNTTYVSNLQTSAGCDSIITTNVTMTPLAGITLNNPICSGENYTYADGTIATNITANTSHTSVLTSSAGCDSTIIENLTVIQTVTVVLDTNLCPGSNFTYADGANTVNIQDNLTHTSTLTSSNGCDSIVIQNLFVIPLVDLSLPADMQICPNEPISITATTNGVPVWNNGDTNMTITFTPINDTTVFATVTGQCNSVTDSLNITILSNPVVDAGPDITIPYGATVDLSATGASSYLWSPGQFLSCTTCSDPTVVTTANTTFIVVGTDDNGCMAYDTVNVIIDGEIGIYIPNIFSPNGDGENDYFKVYGPSWKSYTLEIYNRWGGLVFVSEDPNVNWDGKHYKNGEDCPQAVFVYKFRGTATVGVVFERAGTVMLTR